MGFFTSINEPQLTKENFFLVIFANITKNFEDVIYVRFNYLITIYKLAIK